MMQDYNLYEYAVIRVVPRVEREEFLNIGVVLYCAKKKYLQAKYIFDEDKLAMFSKSLDIEDLKKHLHVFESICKGENCNSPIAKLDLPSRFRWLTATRSTILQCSKVHPGFCLEPVLTLEKIMDEMVL
jgi:Protein of unknown function (DUF3037)